MPDLEEMGYKRGMFKDRGKRIEMAMERRGLDQTKLAKLLGIKQPTLHEILRGDTPGTKHLESLVKLLKVDIEWITTGITEEERLAGAHAELKRLAAEVQKRDAQIQKLEAELQRLRGRRGEGPAAPGAP